MKTIKVKLLEPIDGYEDVVELRAPQEGEDYLRVNNEIGTSYAFNADVSYPVLTKKRVYMDLEIGAMYYKEGLCLLEVTGPDSYQYHDPSDGGLTRCRGRSLSCGGPVDLKQWRKVINADGSMVDGDIEWVGVGSYLVTKADLRSAHYEWVCPF